VSEAAADATDVRAWSLLSGVGRVAFGSAMVAAPDATARALGFSEVTPATKAVTRLVGVRDFVLGAVTLAALTDRERLLSATAANATADAGDAAAFALALGGGERAAAVGGLALAIPATIVGIWVAKRLS
jgi:hypothetical protein